MEITEWKSNTEYKGLHTAGFNDIVFRECKKVIILFNVFYLFYYFTYFAAV